MCITDAAAPVRRRQSGLSLVELVVTIVVLSVGLAALLIPLTMVTRHSADPLVTKQMIAVAEAMLEEIELQPFGIGPQGTTCNGCPPTEANRTLFDHVPNYDGFSTVGIFTIDNPAAPIAALASYNISVSAKPAALGVIPAAQAYLITVTVTGPGGNTVTLSSYRTSYY